MDQKELAKTAKLARLKLSEEEQAEFASQLKVVFEYFNKIATVDTESIEPLTYPGQELPISMREDEVQDIKDKKNILDLAPEVLGDEYKVPPVVG